MLRNDAARITRKLKAIPESADPILRKALAKSASEIVASAKSLVPVRTGTLRDSIGWTWGRPPEGAVFTERYKALDGDFALTIYAGNKDAFYARWVEFGVAPHSIARGGGTVLGKAKFALGAGTAHPGIAAQPFFYPAYRFNRKRAARRTKRAIKKAVQEIWNGN